ncbi:MAG: hypothetical protein GY758_01005 [Fuerstiella sp.]|nr:hypothetical protein [Fuerstiella sp.]
MPSFEFRPEEGKSFPPDQLDREFQKIAAMFDTVAIAQNTFTYLPMKGYMAIIDGVGGGGGNPDLVNDYNISTVTREGTGLYRLTLGQSTIFGVDILSIAYPVFQVLFAPPDNNFAYQAQIVAATATTLDIQVNELETAGAGSNVRIELAPIDLESGDRLWVQAYINVKLPQADPLPAVASKV